MKARWLIAAGTLAAALAVAGYLDVLPPGETTERGGPAGKRLYQCSMHPQIVSEKPENCPICAMRLTPVEAEHAPPGAARETDRPPTRQTPLFYRHPMRPDVTSPTPAKDEMGMDYIPVYEESPPAAEGDVPGHAPFSLSLERQQLIGVTRGRVEWKDLALEIRTVGRVAYDPELYQAIVEYREALAARGQLADSRWPEAKKGADAIVRSAALKLRQRGISEEQLARIAPEGQDPVNLLLPGKSVWVYAQVYEFEVDLVKPGQEMVVTAPSMPGKTYTAHVAAVDPILNAMTRTARVRALVSTPDAALRPETFVNAKIHVPLGHRLAVPKAAVFDTGEHQIVFVVKGEGRFEPRSVEIGRDAQGFYEVLAGLEADEEVVTSANFLIDSESRFRAAVAAFSDKPPRGHPH